MLAWDASGWDLQLTRLYGTASGFALRNDFWLSEVLHQGGRTLAWVVLAWLLVCVSTGIGIARSLSRPAIGWLIVTALLGTVLIATLKQFSLTSCPWELREFGGVADYVSHWRIGITDGGPGHCFPSGHASSAFVFLTGYFALRPVHPKQARFWLGIVLLVGAVFGWSQLARGAHYASHTLWTAWWCWLFCCISFHAVNARWPRIFQQRYGAAAG